MLAKPFDQVIDDSNKITISLEMAPHVKEKIEIIGKPENTAGKKKPASIKVTRPSEDKSIQVEFRRNSNMNSPPHYLDRMLDKFSSDKYIGFT